MCDQFKFAIESVNAYGESSADNNAIIPLSIFFQVDGKINEQKVFVGAEISMSDNEGNNMIGKILQMDNENLTMDFNHPLAGNDLHFEGEIIDVGPATADEIAHGHVHG